MIYKLLIKQEDNGCGYSINCGLDLILLTSKTLTEAKEEAKKILIGSVNQEWKRQDAILEESLIYDQSWTIEWAKILEINNQEYINLQEVQNEIDIIINNEKSKREKENRQKLYEQLKKEFET